MKKNIRPAAPSFLTKKIPVYVIFLLLTAVVVIALSMTRFQKPKQAVANTEPASCTTPLHFTQLNGALARPLLMADVSDQSAELFPIKNQIEKYLSKQKDSDQLKTASVYLQKLDNGMWIGINNEKMYTSTGYIRLAILIWYLKKSEENPSVLDKKISFNPPKAYASAGNSKHELEAGKEYSIRELLTHLIVNSDSDAKSILTRNIDTTQFEKVFTDLGMATPNLREREFLINVSDYSKFLRVLYDARYLNTSNSEFALRLLSKNPSAEGMLSPLPPDVKVAHRFSDRFLNNEYDVRESGIVYADDDPYVLTIFTQGKSDADLKAIIANISKMVYDKMMVAP
ncbi:MAG TPA: serine hydrolase [Chitinophagales bacterium]|nr:serine hydrolase [Chitinophagales bacterium]